MDNNTLATLEETIETSFTTQAPRPAPIMTTSRTPVVIRKHQRTIRNGAINTINYKEGKKLIDAAFLNKLAQIESEPIEDKKRFHLIQLMNGFTDATGYIHSKHTQERLNSIAELKEFWLALNYQKIHREWPTQHGKLHIFEYHIPDRWVGYLGEMQLSSIAALAAAKDEAAGKAPPKFNPIGECDIITPPEKSYLDTLLNERIKVTGLIRYLPKSFPRDVLPKASDYRYSIAHEVLGDMEVTQIFSILLNDKFELVKFQVGHLLDELFPHQRREVVSLVATH